MNPHIKSLKDGLYLVVDREEPGQFSVIDRTGGFTWQMGHDRVTPDSEWLDHTEFYPIDPKQVIAAVEKLKP
jgi:hypothetical protein